MERDEPHFELTGGELELVTEQASRATDWLELYGVLEQHAASRSSEALSLVAMAFAYRLGETTRGQDASRNPYELMQASSDGTFPPDPSLVRPPVRVLWRQVADASEEPVVRGRLLDLFFVADGPRAHADGRAAAEALERLAVGPSWSVLDRAVCMARALDIAQELNDAPALSARGPRALALAHELLEQEYPGPPFIVLRALLGLAHELRPKGLGQALEDAATRFKGTRNHEAALELQLRATQDPALRDTLRARQLAALEAEAEAATGLVQRSLLLRAAQFAERHGLRERASELLRELQGLPEEGFERLQVRQEIDADLVAEEVDATAGAGAPDLGQALRSIGSYGPPGGSPSEVAEAVTQQRAENPLDVLLSPVLLARGTSIPIFAAQNEADRQRFAIGQHRAIASGFYAALFIEPMLHRACAHHGRPTHAELSSLWSTKFIGPTRGERIARALELFWDGHPDDSAHVLVPRLESILRDLAKESGMVVYRSPQPGTLGGAKTLGPVMRYLREVSDGDPWVCHIEALLCDPLALNLRNDVAHGIRPEIGPPDAALLLQVACYLLRLEPARA